MSDAPKELHRQGDSERILVAFAEADVEFVVCGGVACVLHGVSRVTNDVDLCVRLDDANLRRVLGVLKDLHAVPRIPEPVEALLDADRRQEWIEMKNAKFFTLNLPDSTVQIDILLEYPIPFEQLARRANTMDLGGSRILFSSISDPIEAKRRIEPMRETDRRDFHDLRELEQRS